MNEPFIFLTVVFLLLPFSKVDDHDFQVRVVKKYAERMGNPGWLEKVKEYAKEHDLFVKICGSCGIIINVEKGEYEIKINHCGACIIKNLKIYISELEKADKKLIDKDMLAEEYVSRHP